MDKFAIKVSVLLVCSAFLTGCEQERVQTTTYDSVTVERRTIDVSVESTGVVEPLATVELKSKASGEVLELLVETGDFVQESDLLVRIDPRTVRNRLDQAEAELKAALSRRSISESQMKRASSLRASGTYTETDYEQIALELANAEAQVVSARVAVENARIAVDDTDIRAPITGTVIDKQVEKGQVISSPTQDFGGGTLLLKMADLSAVQIRALVDETDIGKVKAGMATRVVVAAYPNQPFAGSVVKVEPQAVVEQNVTMFAVLVSIQNPQGLLMPGMNADVEISIAHAESVLAVPVMALRTDRDLESTAQILDIDEETLKKQTRRTGTAAPDAASTTTVATINVGGREIPLPEGTDPEMVKKIMQKRRAGETLSPEERQLMGRIFQNAPQAASTAEERGTRYRFGGNFWVVTESGGRIVGLPVETGITDLDQAEIVSGLREGDKVMMLPSTHLVETQIELQSWMQRRVGGVPGISSSR
jgi:HlyD family secretion protein